MTEKNDSLIGRLITWNFIKKGVFCIYLNSSGPCIRMNFEVSWSDVVCANIAKHILNNIYIPTPHLLSIIAATLHMKYKK